MMNILLDGLFAAIAAIGFASISHTPARAFLACGITAAVGHAIRYILMLSPGIGLHIIPASTIAALSIGVLSVVFSRRMSTPPEVCFFPALLPMIPGMYAYRTVEALVSCMSTTGEDQFGHYLYLLLFNGLTCGFIIIGMVVGATLPVFLMKRIAFQATRKNA